MIKNQYLHYVRSLIIFVVILGNGGGQASRGKKSDTKVVEKVVHVTNSEELEKEKDRIKEVNCFIYKPKYKLGLQ